METRIYSSRVWESRSASSSGMSIGGYAARFNLPSNPIPSRNGGSFVEVIKPGAFRDALDTDLDCVCLFNHDTNKVLGRTTARTLRLHEDGLGLQFECDLSPEVSHHRDVYEQVKRGDLNGCSFAFANVEDEWSDIGSTPVRTIRSIGTLRDVSVVTNPAYNHTDVGVRSDVDLVEVRSRFVGNESRPFWWFPVCEMLGMNPDTTNKRALAIAWKQAGSPGLEIRTGMEVVEKRRRFINEILS